MWNSLIDAWPETLLAAILGLSCGSFMNVVIVRLPQAVLAASRPTLFSGRSRCPACQHQLAPRDLIPLLSWLLLRGRCRHCATVIPMHYPLTELACMLLFIFLLRISDSLLFLVGYGCLSWFLLALAVIDYRTFLLPDVLTLPLLWLGLIFRLVMSRSAGDGILGAVSGYVLLWGLVQGYRLYCGKTGLGYGDLKLLAALGAWSGWQLLPSICLAASLAGLIWALLRRLIDKAKNNHPLPFGPCLCASGWVVILFYEWV